jgi:hypothetical protein
MTGTASALAVLADCLHLSPDRCQNRPSWPAAADWPAVIALANDHLLGPALHARLCGEPRFDLVPAEVRAYLALLHRLNRQRNRALRRQAEEIIAAFNQNGIEPTLLKGGITLFSTPYPHRDWSSRMMRDLDVLVPAEARARAVAVLAALGYGVLNPYPPEHHAVAEFVRTADPGAVDLHTELVDPWYVLPAAEVRSRAVLLPCGALTVFAPAPTDRVLHHVLHAQVHHRADFYRGALRLNQLYELAIMGAEPANAIDWAFIVARMREHRLEAALESYLLAAKRLFGLPWPLKTAPSRTAKLHVRWCLLQIRRPSWQRLSLPWGNLLGAFAWHRMKALYGVRGSPSLWRLRHAWRFLKKKPVRQAVERVFRTE